MPRNGAGTYNRTNGFYSGATTWAQSKTAGLPMTDNTLHDTHDQDIADALSATLDATGQKSPTANLPMAGFRHTGTNSTIDTTTPRASYLPLDALTGSRVLLPTIVTYGTTTFVPDSINYDYVVLKFQYGPIAVTSEIKDGFTFSFTVPRQGTGGLSGGGGSTRAYVISIANPDTGEYILTANLVNNITLSTGWFGDQINIGAVFIVTWNATQASFNLVMKSF